MSDKEEGTVGESRDTVAEIGQGREETVADR